MGKSYTNIAGGEFKPWVDKQIKLRQKKLASQQRDEQTLNFSTNRNAWYRVTSMSLVKPDHPLVKKYGITIVGDNLAKEFVLQGGVIKRNSKNKIKLRSGVTRGADISYDKDENGKDAALSPNFGNGAYGAIDVSELGYKPMPGITEFSIGTGGKLGVLQEVKLSFKCHNLAQLEIIDTLYMKLGFSIFVEFGHTNYFKNDGSFERNPLPLDPWAYTTKVELMKAIQDKKISESGNWGGLFGTIKNFNWTINKDGSYDCNIEVVGAGDILESLRSNQNSEKGSGIPIEESYADQSEDNRVANDATDDGGVFSSDQTKFLPSVVAQRYASTLENVMYSLYEYGITNYEDQKFSAGAVPAPNVIKVNGGDNVSKGYVSLLNKFYGGSPYSFLKFNGNGDIDAPAKTINQDRYFASRGNSYQVMRHHLDGAESEEPPVVKPYLFNLYTAAFNPAGEGARQIDANDDFDDEGKPQVFITLGHLLAIMNMHSNIFYGDTKKKGSPYVLIDFHPEYTFCNVADTQFAVDPMICMIPFRDKGGFLSTANGDVITPGVVEANSSINVSFEDAAIAGELQNPNATTLGLFFKSFDFSSTRGNNAAAAFLNRINIFGRNENVVKAKKISESMDALKRISAAEDDDANKVTAILNEHAPFFDANNSKRGKLMEVLVNVNFVTSTLSSLKGSKDNAVPTAQLIDEILKGITKNLGGINDFRLYPDDETNVLRILDDKIIDPSKTKYTELRIFGLGNTIYDYSYSSKISNELATQIVVASQAQPEGVNEDDFAFSHLSQGLIDRIQPVKMTTDTTNEGQPANNSDPSGESPLINLADFLRQVYCVMQYSSGDISSASDTARKFFQTAIAKDPSKRGQTLIPLDFSLTMDGLTGLIPHQAFIIDKERLPSTYRINGTGEPRIAFILHSILHNFDNNKWITTIKGQTLNIDFQDRKKLEETYEENMKKNNAASQPKPKPPKVYNGGDNDDGENVGSVTLDKKEAPLVTDCVYPVISPSQLNDEFFDKIIYGVIAHAPSVFGGTGKAFNDLFSLDGGTMGIAHYARGGLADFLEDMIDKYGYSTFFSRGSKSEVIEIAKSGVKNRDVRKGAEPGGAYYVSWVKAGLEKIAGNSKYDKDQYNFLKKKRLRAIKAVYNSFGDKGWNTERAFAITGAIANSYGGGFYKKSWMKKYMDRGPDFTAYYYQYKFGENDFSGHKSTRIKIINQMFPCGGESEITGAQVKAGTPFRTRKVGHVPR